MNSHAKQPTPPTSSRRNLNSPATRWLGLAALGVLALTASSHAEVIWVDHNDQITNADAKWNVFAAPPATATAVVDADGNDDGVTVSYSGFGDSGNGQNHNGAFAATDWDPGSADYFFVGDGTTGTITVAGLQDSEVYTLRLIGSANSGASPRAGDFQVNGGFGDGSSPNNGDGYEAHTDGFDNGEVMTWTGVAPSSGVITITMQDTSGGTNADGTAHFNAFSIEGVFAGAPDTTPPTLDTTASVSPADGATGVVISSNLEATFSEVIALTGSGTITLKNQSGGADIPVTLPDDVSISGAVLTIDPASNLVGGDEYTVEISSDAIEDLAGNDYAGILATDDPNWSFTADDTAPTSSSMGPMADATDVSPFSGLTLSFGEDVLAVAGKNIEIFLADGTPVETIAAADPAVTINGSQVTIDISDLAEATAYYVNIDNGAFTDLSGNAYSGINDDTTWAFTTGTLPAGLIFLEAFSGNGDLNGTSPNVTTGGATWTASDWQKDGTIADQSNVTNSAWLPFVPEAGKTYTLEVTIDAVASGSLPSSWSAFGFGNGSDTNQFWQAPNDAAPWALYRATDTPDLIDTWTGPGVTGKESEGTVAGPVTLSIVLDTTGAQWTAEWFEGANSLRTHTYTTNPAISTVGFGRNADSDGPISSFSLTASGAAPLVLQIAENGGALDFEWNSLSGMQYDLLSSTDPEAEPDPSLWTPYFDGVTTHEDIPATGTTTMQPGVLKVGSKRFFALREESVPPLLSESFDAAGPGLPAGWVPVNATTVWDVGDPSGLPNLQNGDGTNCVGSNVVAGNYADEVATVTLTSPPVSIPAGGATLSFRQYIDSEAPGDVGAVRLLDATDTEIIEGDFPVTGIDGIEAGWTNESFTLPPSAAGQDVKVVFEFTTDADGSVFNGFYIDDVVVTSP